MHVLYIIIPFCSQHAHIIYASVRMRKWGIYATWNAIAAFSEECVEKLVHRYSHTTWTSSILFNNNHDRSLPTLWVSLRLWILPACSKINNTRHIINILALIYLLHGIALYWVTGIYISYSIIMKIKAYGSLDPRPQFPLHLGKWKAGEGG